MAGAEAEKPISGTMRFLCGGVGALAPIFVNLVVVDMHAVLVAMAKDPEGAALLIVEYGVKALALFVVGGTVGFMHDDENKPKKLFQLGLGAPAMIIAGVNGVALGDLSTRPEAPHVAPAAAPPTAAWVAEMTSTEDAGVCEVRGAPSVTVPVGFPPAETPWDHMDTTPAPAEGMRLLE